MLYTFILWGVILGIFALWAVIRGWRLGGPSQSMNTGFDKTLDRLAHLRRKWLLKNSPLKWLFGRVSRLQVLILAVMSAYLTIFT